MKKYTGEGGVRRKGDVERVTRELQIKIEVIIHIQIQIHIQIGVLSYKYNKN